MKQTTIFDYILKTSKEQKLQSEIPLQRIDSTHNQKEGLIKNYIQKSLSKIIRDQEEFQKIKDLLGNSWYRQENGFGFTDKSNIMILSTIQDFNKNFFNLYNFEDFKQLTNSYYDLKDLEEENNAYLVINGVEYSSYYLFKAIRILGEKSNLYQHEKLMLLFLRNSKYAALICPKF
ncbi:MAG: hypothetical protein ACFFCI_14455 [Promethearchaeota archaeon]